METQTLSQPRLPIFSALEREVIRLGIRDGEQTRLGSRVPGLLALNGRTARQRLSNPALEALRGWTELACALLPSGGDAPTIILSDAGYSAAQIAEVRRLVAAAATMDRGERS